MAALKEEDFETFLKRRILGFSSLLLHGDDEAVISSMGVQLVAALSGSGSTSWTSEEIESAACKKSPGLFADALSAMSLLGDRRVLILDSVDDSCLGFLRPCLAQIPGGNFVLLKTQALKRDSELRVAFESGSHSAALAVFPEGEKASSLRARNFLKENDLTWDEGAEQSFFDLVGYDRSVMMQELTKLALYCLGMKQVGQEDVAAICGDLAEESLDDAIDAVLSGDLLGVDRSFGGSGGRDVKSILTQLSMHLSRLVAMKSAVADGQTVDGAVRSAKPPVFFKRRANVMGQLNRLKLEELVKLQISVQAMILKSRQLGDISEAATGRSLLSLARNLRGSAK
jgi:DNA polymerase III subunit delta